MFPRLEVLNSAFAGHSGDVGLRLRNNNGLRGETRDGTWFAGGAPYEQPGGAAVVKLRDAGHGFDELGANPEAIEKVLPAMRAMHRYYFRVRSHDANNVKKSGGTILVANHSGTLPFDGMMIATDVLLHRDRLVRPITDRFLPRLPFFGTWAARVGAVTGGRRNVETLLEQGEAILIFPEGTTGVGKPWSDRYRLQDWRVGHAELAIRYHVPIVPVALVGAEEQMPQIARISWNLMGVPYIPIPATPFPLPVRYHIFYGEPIDLSEYDATDARSVREGAIKVRTSVESLLHHGLLYRNGVFS